MRRQYQQKINNFTLQQLLSLIALTSCALIHTTLTMPTAEFEAHSINEAQFAVIKEDIIPDIENTTQKVIRVNPLDLPAIRDDTAVDSATDSELFTIKAIKPAPRTYVSSKRMRRPRKQMNADDAGEKHASESRIIQQQQQIDGKFRKPKQQQLHKKKQLHFLYNQDALDGRSVGKRMRVRIAPGAYPVYYVVAKTNGRFGKYPIKGFSNSRDFMKYLVKSKLEPIELSKRYES